MLPWLKEKIILRKQRWLRSRCEEVKPQNTAQDDDVGDEANDVLYLKVIMPQRVIQIQISQSDNGSSIKEKALKNNTSSPLHSSEAHLYRLVRSSTKEIFKECETVASQKVQNYEEFVMQKCRVEESISHLITVPNSHGPSEKEILNRTKHLPSIRSSSSAYLNLDYTFLQTHDLQYDLRKILSEIAKYSAYVIGTLSYSEKLIKYYRQKILMNLHNNHDIVQLLSEMGFKKLDILRALKINGNNYSLALDWLVENVSKDEEDNTTDELEQQSNSSESIESSSSEFNFRNKVFSKSFPSPNSIFYTKHRVIGVKERVEALLEIVRYYSEKNGETKSDAINRLINMGFPVEEIQQAMQSANNNQTQACVWLIENSSNTQNSKALRESLFVPHILKILLSTPQIQFSLSSPKFFIAYCSLLENYSSLNIFFNDIESSSLLSFILKTYNEEKVHFHTFDSSFCVAT